MSQTIIQDNIYISGKINGTDIEGMGIFNEILIMESVQSVVPTAAIVLNDTDQLTYQELQLTDGAKFEINIRKESERESDPVTFRLFSDKGSRNYSSGQTVFANFIFDAPKYYSKTVRKAKKGNSSDMISEIASDCGLTAKVDATKDEQIWFGAGQTFASFARHIAQHGYVSESSCMVVATNCKGELLYKDLNQIMTGSAVATLYSSTLAPEDDPSALIIAGNKSNSIAGFTNNWVNYGFLYNKWGITGEDEKYENINAQKREDNLAISSEIKADVEMARLELSCFDVGNTHKDYYKAYYQNLRYRALFNDCLSVIVQDYTGAELLDVVEVIIGVGVGEDTTAMEASIRSGFYIVVAKTKVIRQGFIYGERLELLRNSIRNNGSNPLS